MRKFFTNGLDADRTVTHIPKDYRDSPSVSPQSGYFDLPESKECDHPDHNFPGYKHIPQGNGYRHVCPKCGQEQVIIPQQYKL
jgi:hypothetical protein